MREFMVKVSSCIYVVMLCCLCSISFAADKPKVAGKKCEVSSDIVDPGARAEWKGPCVDGRAQGVGSIVWYDKGRKQRVFEGDVVDGVPDGKGSLTWDNNRKYQGEFSRGRPSGMGEMQLPNGNRYEGWFLDGLPQGAVSYSFANGDRYQGAVADDVPHGIGTLTARNGGRLLGLFAKGVATGSVSLRLPDGSRYEGSLAGGKATGKGLLHLDDIQVRANFVDGVANGSGQVLFPDNSRYEGPLTNNRPKGRGVLVLANGDRCEGEFREDGKVQGPVVYRFVSGNVFEGEFQDGLVSGSGTLKFAAGGEYQGSISGGLPRGQGTLKHAGGGRYEGQFGAGRRHGKGSYVWADGLRYDGEFQNDVPEGEGQYTWPDGSQYTGSIDKGLPSGQGLMKWPGGRSYQGSFVDGLADGQGVISLPDKTRYQGIFTEGLKDGKGEVIAPEGNRTALFFDNDIPREEYSSYFSLFKSKAEELGGLMAHAHFGWAERYYQKHQEYFDSNAGEHREILDSLANQLAEPANRRLSLLAGLAAMRLDSARGIDDLAALKTVLDSAAKPVAALSSRPLLIKRKYRSAYQDALAGLPIPAQLGAALAQQVSAGDLQGSADFLEAARASGFEPALDKAAVALAEVLNRRARLAVEQQAALAKLQALGIALDKGRLQAEYAKALNEALAGDDIESAFDIFAAADVLTLAVGRQDIAATLSKRLAVKLMASQNLPFAMRALGMAKRLGMQINAPELREAMMATIAAVAEDGKLAQVLAFLDEAARQQLSLGDGNQAGDVYKILQGRLDANQWGETMTLYNAFRKVGVDAAPLLKKRLAIVRTGIIGGNTPFPLALKNDTDLPVVVLDSLGDEPDSFDFLNSSAYVVIIDLHPRSATLTVAQRQTLKSSYADGFQEMANPDYQRIEIDIQNAQMEYSRATGQQLAKSSSGLGLPGLGSSGNKSADRLTQALDLLQTVSKATGGEPAPTGADAILLRVQALQAKLLETPRTRREPINTEYQYAEVSVDVSRHVPVTFYLLNRARESFVRTSPTYSQSESMATTLGINTKDKTAKRLERLDKIKQVERRSTPVGLVELSMLAVGTAVAPKTLDALVADLTENREQQETRGVQLVEQAHQGFDKAMHEILAGLHEDARARDEQVLELIRHQAEPPYREGRDSRKLAQLVKKLTGNRLAAVGAR
jgi:hypothetical protein